MPPPDPDCPVCGGTGTAWVRASDDPFDIDKEPCWACEERTEEAS